MKRRILRVRSVEKERRTTKSMPEVWGPAAITTEDAVVIVQRIGSHYVVSIMTRPIDSAKGFSLVCIHWSRFLKLLQTIITEGREGKRHAQGRNKKHSR